jgi:hypothetical protein
VSDEALHTGVPARGLINTSFQEAIYRPMDANSILG